MIVWSFPTHEHIVSMVFLVFIIAHACCYYALQLFTASEMAIPLELSKLMKNQHAGRCKSEFHQLDATWKQDIYPLP